MKESEYFRNRYMSAALMGMLMLSSCSPGGSRTTPAGEIPSDMAEVQEQSDAARYDTGTQKEDGTGVTDAGVDEQRDATAHDAGVPEQDSAIVADAEIPDQNDANDARPAEEYVAADAYEDILFFEDRVNDEERELFLRNHQDIGDAVLDACTVYFPDLPLRHCSRITIATILKESTFNQYEVHEAEQPYPTVGLLQIRRSSTVESYYQHGNTMYLQERGIFFDDPTIEQMEHILYNVHLGTWYISLHARSNARYTSDYCREDGEAGSIAVGLSSHRIGPTAYQRGENLETAEAYVAWIRERYLELFEREGTVPEEDYFSLPLARLEDLCAG